MKAVELTVNALGRLNRFTLYFCGHATIILVASITVVVCAGVFWRYALNDALSWTEETAKFLMVWLVFTGAPIALRNGGHAAIDVLPNALPARARQGLYAVVYLIVLALMVVLIDQGYGFALNASTQATATTQISMMYIFAAMPIGGAIMLFVSLELALRAFLGIFVPENGVHLSDAGMAESSPK